MKAYASSGVAIILAIITIPIFLHMQEKSRQRQAREYVTARRTLISQLAESMITEDKALLPSRQLSKSARHAVLADRMLDTAKTYALFAHRMRALKPPPDQAQINSVIAQMYEDGSQEYIRWAAAERKGDSQAADAESDRIQQINDRYIAALEKLGVKIPVMPPDSV